MGRWFTFLGESIVMTRTDYGVGSALEQERDIIPSRENL